jgi:hypothetical protein
MCDETWSAKGYSSLDQCRILMKKAADAMLVEKLERYSKYMTFSLVGADSNALVRVAALIKRGATDMATHDTNDGSSVQCVRTCKSTPMPANQDLLEFCIIPCIERTDQVTANVLRCMSSPDRLPF